MQIAFDSSRNLNFGWNLKTHAFITGKALENVNVLSCNEKKYIAKHSKDPDLVFKEIINIFSEKHLFDIQKEGKDGSALNNDNALSNFIKHTLKAFNASAIGDRKNFLISIARAVHYLQDGSTPVHTKYGNFLQKLFRFPMHELFEVGYKIGTLSRQKTLEKGYKYEKMSVESLNALFYNTVLYASSPENQVAYSNIRDWFDIQQRCVNKSINASKAYFDYIMQFMPDVK